VADDPQTSGRYERQLVRGARVNALGTAAKMLYTVFLLPVTWLYGPTVVGIYLVVTALVELCASLMSSGLRDGLVVFAGRGDAVKDVEHRAVVHRLIGSSFAYGAISCAIVAGSAWLAGADGIRALFSREDAQALGDELAALVPIFVLALPCMVLADLSIAATRALMIMEYDTIIVGFGKPALLIVTAGVAVFVRPDIVGLAWGYVVTYAVLAAAGLWALSRHFELRELLRAMLRPRFERALLAFAVPQSLNMSLNSFITNVDQLVLSYFGVGPAMIAFYGTGARVLRAVRQAKLTFGGAFAPVIARLYAEQKIAELEHQAATVARWSTTIAMPAVLAIVGLRREIMLIFDASYTHDTTFMVLLAIPMLLSCAFGLAANVIVMTGHSRWNLFNSILTATLTLALAPLLVPRWGILGAAVTTVVVSSIVSALQVVEAKRLVGVGVALGLLYKPLLAGAVGAGVLVLLGTVMPDAAFARILAALAAVAAYVVTLLILRLDPRDRQLFALRRRK